MVRDDVQTEVKPEQKTEVVEVEVNLGLINQKLNYIISKIDKE